MSIAFGVLGRAVDEFKIIRQWMAQTKQSPITTQNIIFVNGFFVLFVFFIGNVYRVWRYRRKPFSLFHLFFEGYFYSVNLIPE